MAALFCEITDKRFGNFWEIAPSLLLPAIVWMLGPSLSSLLPSPPSFSSPSLEGEGRRGEGAGGRVDEWAEEVAFKVGFSVTNRLKTIWNQHKTGLSFAPSSPSPSLLGGRGGGQGEGFECWQLCESLIPHLGFLVEVSCISEGVGGARGGKKRKREEGGEVLFGGERLVRLVFYFLFFIFYFLFFIFYFLFFIFYFLFFIFYFLFFIFYFLFFIFYFLFFIFYFLFFIFYFLFFIFYFLFFIFYFLFFIFYFLFFIFYFLFFIFYFLFFIFYFLFFIFYFLFCFIFYFLFCFIFYSLFSFRFSLCLFFFFFDNYDTGFKKQRAFVLIFCK